jgi:hypothetical protein
MAAYITRIQPDINRVTGRDSTASYWDNENKKQVGPEQVELKLRQGGKQYGIMQDQVHLKRGITYE